MANVDRVLCGDHLAHDPSGHRIEAAADRRPDRTARPGRRDPGTPISACAFAGGSVLARVSDTLGRAASRRQRRARLRRASGGRVSIRSRYALSMKSEIEASRTRTPIVKKAFAGLILVAVAALAIHFVIGLVVAVFWIAVVIAAVIGVLWAVRTLF